MKESMKDNCLAIINPKLDSEWHPTKNGDLSSYDVTHHSNKKVWWLCPQGHEYNAHISDRSRRGDGCPYCSGHRNCYDNCLAITNPNLALEWHPTKNGDLSPYDVTRRSSKIAWWLCIEGHEYIATLSNRSRKEDGCPYCDRRVCYNNCLAIVNPDLASEWHPIKNGDLSPYNVTKGSNKKVWWICPQGHEYRVNTNKRSSEEGCPYCSSHRVCYDNCLTIVNPNLALEWHPIKNGDLSPYNVTHHSGKKVWWICPQGHEYRATLANRSNGKGCSYCNKIVCYDNCLAIVNPDLILEWHPTKNGDLSPYDVMIGSNKKAWWLCPQGHNYNVRINNRSSKNKSGCSDCGIGKTQKRISAAFKKIYKGKVYDDHKKLDWLRNKRNLEIDIYIPELKLAVECDGDPHDKPVRFGGISEKEANEAFVLCKERDAIKDELIKHHIKHGGKDIKHFVRINYNYEEIKTRTSDKEIEEIVLNILKKIEQNKEK